MNAIAIAQQTRLSTEGQQGGPPSTCRALSAGRSSPAPPARRKSLIICHFSSPRIRSVITKKPWRAHCGVRSFRLAAAVPSEWKKHTGHWRKEASQKLVQMGGASKSPGRSSTNKSSAKGSGKGGGGSIAYPRKAAAIPKWTVTAYIPPRKISDKELEAARTVSGE